MTQHSIPDVPATLKMSELIRAKDWSKTILGPTEKWPPSLSLLVNVMLASGFPMAVRWGPEFVMIYNDGYAPILGDKHPWGLGLPFAEVWPEVQATLRPLHEAILSGRRGAFFAEDLLLRIQRHGAEWEDARFTISYSPIPDPSSPTGVGGVHITAVETTDRALLLGRTPNRSQCKANLVSASLSLDIENSQSETARSNWGQSIEMRNEIFAETNLRSPKRPILRRLFERMEMPEKGDTGWLGRQDSNLGMVESKSTALPLGYAPKCRRIAAAHRPNGRRNIAA